MRVLLLENDTHRIEVLKDRLGHHELVFASSSYEAIQYLTDATPFDSVYLEYELEGELVAGGTVAFYIATLPEDRRPRTAIILTHNRDGACQMGSLLSRRGIAVLFAPFQE